MQCWFLKAPAILGVLLLPRILTLQSILIDTCVFEHVSAHNNMLLNCYIHLTLNSFQASFIYCWLRYPLWNCYYMMTSSNGNIFRVTGHLCGEFTGPGEFPTQRPVTRSFDVYFDLRPNKRLSKHSLGWWFETLSPPLWRHRNEMTVTGHYWWYWFRYSLGAVRQQAFTWANFYLEKWRH